MINIIESDKCKQRHVSEHIKYTVNDDTKSIKNVY